MAKASKRQALGRGLSALLDDSGSVTPSNESVIGNVVELTLDQIEMNPFQPRTNFNHEAIEDLAKSIQSLGVIQNKILKQLKTIVKKLTLLMKSQLKK